MTDKLWVEDFGDVPVDGVINVGAASKATGSLNLSGGTIDAQQLLVGAAPSSTGAVTIVGGMLMLHGVGDESLQISNGVIHIEGALIKWANSNVTARVTELVQGGLVTWSNGLPHGTYSANGFDGQLVSGDSVLYWDNLDNGSQFSDSAIWVEQRPVESMYDVWVADFGLKWNRADSETAWPRKHKKITQRWCLCPFVAARSAAPEVWPGFVGRGSLLPRALWPSRRFSGFTCKQVRYTKREKRDVECGDLAPL